MLLSTSSSDRTTDHRVFLRAAWALLAAIALFAAAGEIGIRVAYRKWSAIEGRIAREYREALAIRSEPEAPPAVLFLGNSLLLEALDLPALSERLAPRARVGRFAIEGTGYPDWRYGIRRLLAEGARPDVVVLCMSADGMMAPDIRGDYSSYYLFNLADIPAIASGLHYDLTRNSSLYFAHFSLFYAARNNYRVFVMNEIDMPYSRVAQALEPHTAAGPPGDESVLASESRLRVLREEARGIRVLLLVPPGSLPYDRQLTEGGRRAGVDVMIPYLANTMPRSMFRDETHLNREGAALFTAAVEAELRARGVVP